LIEDARLTDPAYREVAVRIIGIPADRFVDHGSVDDLRSLLRKVREYKLPMPEALAATVIMKVASALDYAHRKRAIDDKELKLVHRDVSPQNILISYEGAVKLVDFGIAKAATKTTQTMAGALKGKLLYMSPEQALGQSLDGRSDIYSLGLVLFELLTGERCFQADSELGVLEKVRMGRVQDVRAVNPAVSAEMAAVVGKALNKDVDRRYVSARFLERDLKNLLTRNHNEPNEHDVAEYVNVLLKGTLPELSGLLLAKYPPPALAPPPVQVAPPIELPVLDPPMPVAPAELDPGPVFGSPDQERNWNPRLLLLLPVVLGAVALLAWGAMATTLTVRFLFTQVGILAERMREIQGGASDLTARATIAFNDEIGSLTYAFNSVLGALQAVFGSA